MNDIIRIVTRRFGSTDVTAVDAREVHTALGVGRDFSNWIKGRIEELSLVIHEDFEVFAESGENGGRPRLQYVVSLDAAKHLAMAERNARGREVRAHFIACEKKLRERTADPLAVFRDPAALRTALLGYVEENLALKAEVESQSATITELAPKADAHDALMDSLDTLGFRAAVKVLHRTTAVTEREVRSMLIQRNWVQRLDGTLMPAAYGEQRGYVTTRVTEYRDQEGVQRSRAELRITNKGVARLQKLLTTADA